MKRRAVLVGVDHYRDEAFHELRFAVEDAYRWRDFLGELPAGERFDRIRVLREPADHEVVEALDRAAEGLGAGDLLLFYFAGHGMVQKNTGTHLLLCPQANPAVLEYGTNGALPLSFLESLTRRGPFDCLFIFDACRTSVLKRGRGEERMRASSQYRDLGASRARGDCGICAKAWSCADDELAEEKGDLEEGQGGGLFTFSLIEALRERMNAGGDVVVDAPLVLERVARQMEQLSGGTLRQHPQFSGFGGPGIVLARSAAATAAAAAPPPKARPPAVTPPPPPPEALWHVAVEGRVSAGMPLAELLREIEAGRVTRGTMVWSAELELWTPAGQVPALARAFPALEVSRPPVIEVRTEPPAPPPPVPTEPKAGEVRTVDLGKGVSLDLVWIPPGEFLMGSPKDEEGRDDDEGPQHRVTITSGFWMGKYEVTQLQYKRLMGENPSHFLKAGPDAPVEGVTWREAKAFCERLQAKLPADLKGRTARLPTEAEWEYACRAETTTPFHYGDSLDSSMANVNGNFPYDRGAKGEYRETTVKVGSFRPNAWGLYDMHGNVWEWCWDGKREYTEETQRDPMGPTAAVGSRVVRGGSWYNYARYCRSANRYDLDPGYSNGDLGFRVVVR